MLTASSHLSGHDLLYFYTKLITKSILISRLATHDLCYFVTKLCTQFPVFNQCCKLPISSYRVPADTENIEKSGKIVVRERSGKLIPSKSQGKVREFL